MLETDYKESKDNNNICSQCGHNIEKGTYHYCEHISVQPVTIFNNYEFF